MQRYHKSLYFNQFDNLEGHIYGLNGLKWKISRHSLDRIQEKADIEGIGLFLKDLKLRLDYLFEYYKEGQNIIKTVYRVPFNSEKDLILVLSSEKAIVTVYFNHKADLHYTLNKSNYSLQ